MMWATVQVTDAQQVNNCPSEFYPCTCTSATVYDITCNGVPISSIQASFQRTQATYVNSLLITLAVNDTNNDNEAIIPPNFTNGKPISGPLTINCNQQKELLMIDPFAIPSSAYYTTSLTISSCNLSRLDFAFLNDFKALATLSIQSSSSFNYFLGLPSLAGLRTVKINGNKLLEQLNTTLPLPKDLTNVNSLDLSSNTLSTKSAGQILNMFRSAGAGSSVTGTLSLNSNQMFAIPQEIYSFEYLTGIDLSNNLITTTTRELFSSSVALKAVNLNNNKIALIKPDTFVLSAKNRLSISLRYNGLNTIQPGSLFSREYMIIHSN